jgi:hypothetical protein
MGIIYSNQKCKKPKRKPGWREAEAQQQVWLKSIQTMSSGIQKPKTIVAFKPQRNPPRMLTDTTEGLHPAHVARYVPGVGGKSVPRPEILYKDDPEMLERELAARARRFNVAPAYNKGPDILVTEDEITAQLVGGRRR